MKNFKDKVVLITGSSMGIGKELAQQLLAAGAILVLNGRNTQRLKQTVNEFQAQGYQVIGIPGDVSQLNDCQQIIDHSLEAFGRIDLLINNAGVNMIGRFDETIPQKLDMVMDINFHGSAYMTRLAIETIKANRGGIMFVSSAAGIHGLPQYGLYSASKMALLGLAESLRAELADTGVYVGIAYVGITENEQGKTIYNTDGKKIPKETVRAFGVQPIPQVAAAIIRMIKHQRFKSVFSPLGKVNAFLNRLSPRFVQWILTRNYQNNRPKT